MVAELKNKKKKISVRQILLGSALYNEKVLKQMPLIGLLTILGLVMITNRYKGEKIVRNMVATQDTVNDLRSESASVDAHLMNLSRYSRVLSECQKRGLGLVRPKEPAYEIRLND